MSSLYPDLGPAAPGTASFGPLSVGDDWSPAQPYQLWRAVKLTVYVGAGAAVLVRLSRTMPPNPPEWDQPAQLQAGAPWSHAGLFGYWQFRNVNPVAGTTNAPAVVSGSAFRE